MYGCTGQIGREPRDSGKLPLRSLQNPKPRPRLQIACWLKLCLNQRFLGFGSQHASKITCMRACAGGCTADSSQWCFPSQILSSVLCQHPILIKKQSAIHLCEPALCFEENNADDQPQCSLSAISQQHVAYWTLLLLPLLCHPSLHSVSVKRKAKPNC